MGIFKVTFKSSKKKKNSPHLSFFPVPIEKNIYNYYYRLLLKPDLFFLATPHGMWDLSSPTRGQTHAPCTGSMESQPLDHQGSPLKPDLQVNS